jgi:hypothetical protein
LTTAYRELTRSNFQIYAAKAYKVQPVSMRTFQEDCDTISRISLSLSKFISSGEEKFLKLAINNVVIACNCLDVDFVVRSTFLLDSRNLENHLACLFTWLEIMPDELRINSTLTIRPDRTQFDFGMLAKLEEFTQERPR